MESLRNVFSPNKTVSKQVMLGIMLVWLIAALFSWIVLAPKIIPRPLEVLAAFGPLWKQGAIVELGVSFWLNIKALFFSSIISLALAYLTVLAGMRPAVAAVGKLRFLGLMGLSLIFTLTVGGGEWLKVTLLTFGMTVYFVTSMAATVAKIPRERFDHARTLRMSEWRVVWEVVVLGQMDEAFEALRQNAAIGWMMLTMVEGMVKSGGGIGVMLVAQDKYFKLDSVFAIQFLILFVGIGLDYTIGVIKNIACPYAQLTQERK